MNADIRFDNLARTHPEWAPWLRTVREITSELSKPGWDENPPLTAPASSLAPFLAGAILRPDGRAVDRLLGRLISVARAHQLHALAGDGSHDREPQPDEALAVFLAAVNGDHATLDWYAARMGASPEGFRVLADLLPMPYLHACARLWAASPGRPWSQGYCPVCGAWPSFAEVLGVDRARHLRCGRCGAGWPMPALACTYCATTDHATLGTLVVNDNKSRFAIDVCRGCSGYLKSWTTLQATPSDEIIAIDFESVEFDLAATDRGFHRPPTPGVSLQASLENNSAALRPPPRWRS